MSRILARVILVGAQNTLGRPLTWAIKRELQTGAKVEASKRISTQTFGQKETVSALYDDDEDDDDTFNENDLPDDSDIDSSQICDREFVAMTVDDFAELHRNNPEVKKLISTILDEYEFEKYNTLGRVPSVISVVDMERLVDEGTTVKLRLGLFNYLFKREMHKRAYRRKKETEKKAIAERRKDRFKEFSEVYGDKRSGLVTDDGVIMYGLWHNTLFPRIPDTRLKNGSSSSRLMQAAMFGRKLIFDFGYGEYMSRHTFMNAIDQVQEAYGMNRFVYKEPFDLWFCNFDKKSIGGEYCANKAIQNLYDSALITVKEDCFTNHFDKSQLVYLSPNAKEPLGKVLKGDEIFIIGVFNDKGYHQPVSARKALKLGIKAKCLPIDQHLAWKGPTKSLCINHVAGILLEYMANGGDWTGAMEKHIPSRKVKSMELVREEEERRLKKYQKKSGRFTLRNDFD